MPAFQTSGFAFQGAGQFAFQEAAGVVTPPAVTTGGGGRMMIYPYPTETPHIKVVVKTKKKKKEIAYISIQGPVADYSDLMRSLNDLQRLLEHKELTLAQIRRKIRQYEDEQDILFILSFID